MDKPLDCIWCSMQFSTLPSLRNHQDIVHPLEHPEHQHQFNIPVEWKYSNQPIGIKVVTKLKCTGCNEEQDR